MDADALSLLIILRQELKAIAKNLQPQTEIIEDIMTDNGLINDNPNLNDKAPELSLTPPPDNEHDEDEKAPELKLKPNDKATPNNNINYNHIGFKVDELIQNYLTPTIKQLNKKQKKNRKKRKKSEINSYYSQSPSPSPFIKDAHSHSLLSPSLISPSLISPPQHRPAPKHNGNKLVEPGQVIDTMSDYSEKLGSCCRKFVTSLFCGCGLFQSIGLIVVILMFGAVFIFYRASEITLILKELNHWKELSVKRVEYEFVNQQKLAQINFDLDVDIDKMKQEHQHRETMQIIKTKEALTKEFIDKNTRTVTTTYWNFLTTETETVSQTIFSEEDIAFFHSNILSYGFDADKAIQSPQDINNKRKKEMIDAKNGNDNENDTDAMRCTSDSELCSTDDFDSI